MNMLIMDLPENSAIDSNTYEISLTNQIEELEKLTDWLNELSEDLKISLQTAFRIDLILTETVTNIIENAYDDEPIHLIKIKLQYRNGRITLRVEDEGIPFNPLERPEFEFTNNLEDVKIGGLGIHLIRSYSDECHYRRKNDKNRLDVVIYDLPQEQIKAE